MAKKKAKSKPATTASFEESLDQLKQTVSQLENGNLSLSDSLEEGNLITRPFNNTASEDIAEGSRRSSREPSQEDEPDDTEEEEEDDTEEPDSIDDLDDPNSLF